MSLHTLIDCTELAERLDAADLVVFDCRHDLDRPDWGYEAYTAGHIPGARFLHLDRDLSGPLTGGNGRHPLPDPDQLAARLGALGVSTTTQVVVYDDVEASYAARLWWLLRWLGHAQVAVLDGGLKRWLAEGRPLERHLPAPAPATLPRRVSLAPTLDAATLLHRLNDPHTCLLDARAADRYRGENETRDPVGGHIPGALNRPFRSNLTADGRFKPAADLRAEYLALLGQCSPAEVVHQCGSGVTACHNLLAMEIAGLSGSRLYPGSWSEWCADPARPITRG